MTKVGDKKAARKFCGALRRAADPKAYEGLMYQLAEKLRRLPGKVLGTNLLRSFCNRRKRSNSCA